VVCPVLIESCDQAVGTGQGSQESGESAERVVKIMGMLLVAAIYSSFAFAFVLIFYFLLIFVILDSPN
jgi:hypothetical protein